jgi:Family of unknown function (DUF6158)/Protein of unknown function (DUF2795)
MTDKQVSDLLDEVYVGRERVTRDEIHRWAVSADLPADLIALLDALPEGEYAQEEVEEALTGPAAVPPPGARAATAVLGVPADELSDADLGRELAHLHEKREETFRHGSPQALARHDERTAELEKEYLRRFPEREVDPQRLRSGARRRT